MLNTFGWIASCAGFIAPFPTVLLALVSFLRPGYVLEAWHVFVIFQILNFLLTAYNIYLLKKMMWVMNIGCKSLFIMLHRIQ